MIRVKLLVVYWISKRLLIIFINQLLVYWIKLTIRWKFSWLSI